MIINLNDDMLIGSGHKRLCYKHPDDSSRLIKIERKKDIIKNDSLIESIYYAHLKKNEIDFSHIAKCHGWIETSKGRGLIFERVVNFDGSSALTLEETIANKKLTKDQIDGLLKELETYLKKNQILFADVGLGNILCQNIDGKKWKLVLVDGLGSRTLDFKFKLRMRLAFYNKYKIKTQWKRFMNKYRKKFH